MVDSSVHENEIKPANEESLIFFKNDLMSNVVLCNHYFKICVQEKYGLLNVIMSGEIDELLWDQIIGTFNIYRYNIRDFLVVFTMVFYRDFLLKL